MNVSNNNKIPWWFSQLYCPVITIKLIVYYDQPLVTNYLLLAQCVVALATSCPVVDLAKWWQYVKPSGGNVMC